MHFVYAIYNSDHQKIYIGETDDLKERIAAHNNHRFRSSYTSRFSGSWELVYSEKYVNRQEARKREKQLKSYRGRQFLKQFLPG